MVWQRLWAGQPGAAAILKIRHNDFIFSVLAHEFGFVGTVIVVAALVFVIIRCFKVAENAPDAYGALIAYGFGVLMGFQTIVNIGVNLRVLPVTGLTLPFISYGGAVPWFRCCWALGLCRTCICGV